MTRIEIDPQSSAERDVIQILKSVVVPRPIAWVSTISADGIENLAPHSFFTVASESPPIVQFTSIGDKDSLRNVRETGEFVVAMASEHDFELVNSSATDYPHEVSEFEAVGIEAEPSAVVRPRRVAGSPTALECRLVDTVPIGGGTVVFGEVVHLAINADTMNERGRPDITKLRPLARLGGIQWSLIGEIRDLARIPYDDVQED